MTKYKREKDTKSDIEIRTIKNSIEELIITGMVVSSKFYQETRRATNPNYFQSLQAKTLVEWIHEYAEKNDYESPGEEIKEILEMNLPDLDRDEARTMEIFLDKVLKTYSGREFNTAYVANKAFPYLEEKAYIYRVHQIQLMLRKGELQKAKDLFNSAKDEVFAETNQVRSMSDLTMFDEWWWDRKEPAMTFPGELGEYMPNIYKGKLYAMLGPAKRGKSYWLGEWCTQGVMSGLSTVLFSLEMALNEGHERWITRISGKEIMNKKDKVYKIPVVDCVNNQTGECQRRECTSLESIVATIEGDDVKRQEFEDHPEHIPCTVCRSREDDLFEPTTWFIEEKIDKLNLRDAHKAQTMFDDQYAKDRFRFLTFPIGTASVEDIENTLNDLEQRDGFLADLVVIDYADIMKKGKGQKELRLQLREIWEELSRLAKTRNCIVVTATQGNRGSIGKDKLTVEDIAEDISKVMIIDGIFAINEEGQREKDLVSKDRYWQVHRIETLMLRYGNFPIGRQCICLNDRARGQICMDSYID